MLHFSFVLWLILILFHNTYITHTAINNSDNKSTSTTFIVFHCCSTLHFGHALHKTYAKHVSHPTVQCRLGYLFDQHPIINFMRMAVIYKTRHMFWQKLGQKAMHFAWKALIKFVLKSLKIHKLSISHKTLIVTF